MAELNLIRPCLYIKLPYKEGYDEVDVRNGEFHIGRASSNDYVIPEPDVSRHHLTLKYKDGAWWVVCESKSENTWYNNEHLDPSAERQLFDLDKIILQLKD